MVGAEGLEARLPAPQRALSSPSSMRLGLIPTTYTESGLLLSLTAEAVWEQSLGFGTVLEHQLPP